MVTPSLTHSIPKYLRDRIEFEDMVESAEKWIPVVLENKNPDLIVGLFYSGLGTEKPEYVGENVSLYTVLNVKALKAMTILLTWLMNTSLWQACSIV